MSSTTSQVPTPSRRQRGSVRPHYGQWQARVSAGTDPATGERIILHETLATEREAEKALTRLLAEADALKTARTKASFGFLLDRWFPQHEVGPSTRATYESLIRNHIRPALGGVTLTKLQRSAAEILEAFTASCAGAAVGATASLVSTTESTVHTAARRGAAGRTGASRSQPRASDRFTP